MNWLNKIFFIGFTLICIGCNTDSTPAAQNKKVPEKIIPNKKLKKKRNDIPFSKLTPTTSSTIYSVDIVNGESTKNTEVISVKGKNLTIVGWAIDNRTMKPSKQVFAGIDGVRFEAQHIGLKRKDVSKALKNPILEKVGYKIVIPLNKIKAGISHINMHIVSSDGRSRFAPDLKKIIKINNLSRGQSSE